MIALEFHTIRQSIRFRMAEWGCSACLAMWGWILLQPVESMANNPAFVVMRQWARETTWGWAAIIAGVCSLAVLAYNGRFKHFPEARMIMACLRCFVWASILWGLLRANLFTLGLAPYGTFLAMDLYTIYISSYEAGLERKARRNGGV